MAHTAADPAKRREAANAVFVVGLRRTSSRPSWSRSPGGRIPAVKAALVQARAAILATMPDATADQRVEAINIVKLRGDQMPSDL